MERYFLKYVKSDGTPGKRATNWETMGEAMLFAMWRMDEGIWIGWALYEVPDHWNWDITPPAENFVMLCMSPDWMKLI